jgi:hypothetical protein
VKERVEDRSAAWERQYLVSSRAFSRAAPLQPGPAMCLCQRWAKGGLHDDRSFADLPKMQLDDDAAGPCLREG